MWGCLSWKYSFMEAATTLPHLYIGGPFLTMLKVSLISSLEKFFLEFDVYSYSETDMYDSMIDSEELLFYGFMWKLNLRCGWLFRCHIQPLKAETIPSRSPDQVSSFIIFIWHVHRSTVARFVLPKSWGSFPTCLVSPGPEPPATSSFTSNSSSAFLSDGGASSLLPSHHCLFQLTLTESSELWLRFEKNVNKPPVPGPKLIWNQFSANRYSFQIIH